MVDPGIKYVARAEFLAVLAPALDAGAVSWMRGQRHHLCVTVLEHSLFVAYVAYLIARRWSGCDPAQAARAGFLHDLYMYDRHDRGAHDGFHCFSHPEHALANAVRVYPGLSANGRNAVVAHMFPLARHLPRCREAWAVSFADKFCAVLEGTGLSRRGFVRRHRPAGPDLDFAMSPVGNILA